MTSSAAVPVRQAGAERTRRWDFDLLRVIAILGVVSIHVMATTLTHPELRGTPTWWFAIALDIGFIWCVPVFVMLSGALLLAPSVHAAGPQAFYRRRLLRLLPALVVWHAVYLFLVRGLLLDQDLELRTVVALFVDGTVSAQLYFLWLILGLYAVAPVLVAFLDGSARRARMLALAACAWMGVLVAIPGITNELGVARPRPDNALTMWVWYVGIFAAGYAWREPRATGRRWLWTGATATALLALQCWQWSARPDPVWLQAVLPVGYLTPTVVLASVCVFITVIDLAARWRPSAAVRRWLRVLGDASFGVFLCHLVFLALLGKVAPELHTDPSPQARLAVYGVVVLCSFAFSIAIARVPVLRRIV